MLFQLLCVQGHQTDLNQGGVEKEEAIGSGGKGELRMVQTKMGSQAQRLLRVQKSGSEGKKSIHATRESQGCSYGTKTSLSFLNIRTKLIITSFYKALYSGGKS